MPDIKSGRKRFMLLILPGNSPSLREVTTGTPAGQEPGGRSRRRQRPWRALLTGLLSSFSYISQDYLPRVSTTHSLMDHPTSINNT